MLEGQECRLHSKYDVRCFQKRRNLPIIMMSNTLPQLMKEDNAFRARYFRIRFTSQIKRIEEERVIATLYGCMVRRINQTYGRRIHTSNQEVEINYNSQRGIILPIFLEPKPQIFLKTMKFWNTCVGSTFFIGKKGLAQKAMDHEITRIPVILLTNEGKIYELRALKGIICESGREIILFQLVLIKGKQWETWQEEDDYLENEKIDLLNFDTIPIQKKEEEAQPINDLDHFFPPTYQEQEKVLHSNEQQTITTVKRIFLEHKEREWIRNRKGISDDVVNAEEVISDLLVHRYTNDQHYDYSYWPLELKVYTSDLDKEYLAKVFPLIIYNEEQPNGENALFLRGIANLSKMIKNNIEEIRTKIPQESLRCEISLARNGERQRWNIQC